MKNKIIITLFLILATNVFSFDLFSLFKKDPYRSEYPLVTKQMYNDGLLCKERIFKCLPENKDISLWNIPIPDGVDEFKINKKTEEKKKKILEEWEEQRSIRNSPSYIKDEETMKKDALDDKFLKNMRDKKFLIEMEEQLEKEFPGFWKDTPKKLRYRWINIAMMKAKKFGHDPLMNQAMIELCARIGLYFDNDEKWSDIVKFIKLEDTYIGISCEYLDFTLYDRTHTTFGGNKITDWSLQRAFPHLPYPDKPIPKLKRNDD